MMISCGLVGFFNGFVNVPAVPTFIESMEKEEKERDPNFIKNQRILEISSVLFSMIFASGTIVAPVVGGAISDMVGYQNTATFFVLVTAASSVYYAIVEIKPHLQE